MLEKIWKPDTHFYNGKHSYLHLVTYPNKFIRISQDGRILYSMRYGISWQETVGVRSCDLRYNSVAIQTDDQSELPDAPRELPDGRADVSAHDHQS